MMNSECSSAMRPKSPIRKKFPAGEQKHRRSEESPRSSRKDLERAKMVGQLGCWRLDASRNLLTWCEDMFRILGVPNGTPPTYEQFLELVHPDDRQYVETRWRAALHGASYDVQHRILVSGQLKWVRAKAFLKFDDAGRLLEAFGVIQDITAHKLAEEKTLQLHGMLAQEKERLMALINSVPDEIWFADTQARFTLVNPTGRSEFKLQGDGPFDVRTLAASLEVLRPDGSVRPVEEAPPLRALKGETLRSHEEIVRTPATGIIRYRQVSASPVKDAAGDVVGSVSVVRDITNYRLIEQKLRNLNLELESRVAKRTSELQATVSALKTEISERKRLEREVLRISDYEQSRIGQDLHDGACQDLASLAVLAEVVSRDPDQKNSQVAARMLEIARLARQSADEVRSLASNLLPVKIHQLGLEWALRELADETSARNNVRCRFSMSGPVTVADNNAAAQLFRIAQEATNNALRHATAKNITIGLSESDGTVILVVEDDGTGLPRRKKKSGLGLHTMEYRAKMLGGSLEIGPAAGRGTVVRCSFPGREFLHAKKNKRR
jgi:signal transduction histidine kinase